MSSPKSKWRLIWNIPRLLAQSWSLFKNPAVSGGRKLFLIIIALGYLVWPLDFIPDIPLIGHIDDLGVLFLLLNWFVNKPAANSVPDSIEAEYYYVDEEKEGKEEKEKK